MIRKIFDLLRRDFLRKAMAFVLALLLYFYISERLNDERQINNVPVDLELAPGLFMPEPRVMVSVFVCGPRNELDELSASDLAGSVRVTGQHQIKGNRYEVPLVPENFRQYRRVRVTRLAQRSGKLELQIQRLSSKLVKIVPKFDGKLASAFRQAESRCIPAEVRVSGPENLVVATREIFTEPIPLSESIEESFEYDAKLSQQRGLEVVPERVMVQIDIEHSQILRSFPAIGLSLLSSETAKTRPLEISFEPAAVSVTLSGQPETMARIKAEDLRAYVDVSKVEKPGTYTFPVECHVSIEGVAVKAISPGDVKIKAVEKTLKNK